MGLLRSYLRKKAYSVKESPVKSSTQFYLNKVESVISIENLEEAEEDMNKYYLNSKWAYSLFHTHDNFHHFALCNGKVVKREDYETQPKLISEYIEKIKAKNVLELSSGQGANSYYLANKFPDTHFKAIDLIQTPEEKVLKLKNFQFQNGDYHDLSKYRENSLDLVFIIEALCHSSTPKIVIDQVYSVLKPGGYFIIFDGYRRREISELNNLDKKILTLSEHAMALNEMFNIVKFNTLLKSSNFEVSKSTDYSNKVIPNLIKLEYLARMYYKFPKIAKLVNRFISKEVVQNSITGLFLRTLVEKEITGYYGHILRKF
ncbi:MAG: class I SAM-dependent methyltransferase [Candidatus Dojkabacteria bacterium]|nr:class I SAM-dependent methyltransferase [Candidatus Dojkabacteria bacterium]